MKIRRGLEHDDTVELNMTSMIDIVFQLLVFFIMTFKIVAQEGDFNVRMPAAASGGPPSERQRPAKATTQALQVKLEPDAEHQENDGEVGDSVERFERMDEPQGFGTD